MVRSPSSDYRHASAIRHPPSAIRHPPSAIRHPPSAIRHPPSAIRHPPSAIRQRRRRGLGLLDFHPHRLPADQVRSRRDLTRLRTRSCRYDQKFTPNLRHVFFRLANVSRAARPASLRLQDGAIGVAEEDPVEGGPPVAADQLGAVLLGPPPPPELREGGLRDGDGDGSAGRVLAGEGSMPETSSSWTSRPGAISRQADATAILPGRSIGRHPSVASKNQTACHASRVARADGTMTRKRASALDRGLGGDDTDAPLEAREVPDARSGSQSIRSGGPIRDCRAAIGRSGAACRPGTPGASCPRLRASNDNCRSLCASSPS